MLLLGGPRLPFNAQELQDIRRYIEEGGRCVIMMTEGGETKQNTNINAMLEQVGISVNSDSVIRKTFHKYLQILRENLSLENVKLKHIHEDMNMTAFPNKKCKRKIDKINEKDLIIQKLQNTIDN